MINERSFEKNINSTNPRGSKIEFYTTPQYNEREHYEKDLKEFTLAAMNGLISSYAGTHTPIQTVLVADMALNMAIVQMNAIKQHLDSKYNGSK